MADGKIRLEVVTPARRVLSQDVDTVVVPGEDGSFGVLPGHMPFVASVRAGELVAQAGGAKLVFAIGEGFAQVAADKVLILTEEAFRAEELDAAAAKAELDVETKKLQGIKTDDAGFAAQQARVERAAARVSVSTRK